MKKLGIIAAVVVALIGGLVVAYKLAYPTYSHRYRLTIEVETPDGLKTGSSVIEPQIIAQPKLLTESSAHSGLRGDATFVDLGHGKNVVTLLTGGTRAEDVNAPVTLAINAFQVSGCTQNFCEWRRISRMSGARELPRELTPTLATVGTSTTLRACALCGPMSLRLCSVPVIASKARGSS